MNPTMEKLQALSTGYKVVGGALVVAFIAMFLPWYSVSSGSFSDSVSGFHNWGLAYFLFWLITGAFYVITVFELPVTLPGLPIVDWQLYVIGGVVMLFTGLLFYTDVPSGSIGSVHWGVSFGWWIALIAAVGVIAGGWLSRHPAPITSSGSATLPPSSTSTT